MTCQQLNISLYYVSKLKHINFLVMYSYIYKLYRSIDKSVKYFFTPYSHMQKLSYSYPPNMRRKFVPYQQYYQKQITHNQQQLKKLDNDIAILQDNYLNKTHLYGNLVTGFEKYIEQKLLFLHNFATEKVSPYHKIFSLSSATSPTSLLHGEQFDQRELELYTIKNSKQSQFEFQPRVTRSRFKTKKNKKQLNYKQIELQNEDQPQYRSEPQGSLSQSLANAEENRTNLSQDNNSRTVTEARIYKKAATISIHSQFSELKKRQEKVKLSRDANRWITNRRKRAERLSQTEPQKNRRRRQLSSDEEQGYYIFQGRSYVQSFSCKSEMVDENDRKRRLSEVQSCDIVDLMIRMTETNNIEQMK